MFKRQKISTWFLLHTTAQSLLDRTSALPLQTLPQSDPLPCWFERSRHSIANCCRMVRDSAMVTTEPEREPIGNHHRSFERYHRWPCTTSPSPNILGPKSTPHDMSNFEWSYLRKGSSDPHHVLFYGRPTYGFPGRRIEWRYFRFDQIQGGGNDMTWLDLSRHKVSTRQEPNACLLLPSYFGPCSLSYGANIFLKVDFSVMRGHN